jgi:hypothetical protein
VYKQETFGVRECQQGKQCHLDHDKSRKQATAATPQQHNNKPAQQQQYHDETKEESSDKGRE